MNIRLVWLNILRIIIPFCFLTCLNTAEAQVYPHTLGLRSGGEGNGFGFSTEVSYQYGLNDVNRIEADLGFRIFHNNGFSQTSYLSLTGAYQYVKPLQDNFNWFYGPAAQVASFSFSYNDDDGIRVSEKRTSLGLGGQVGIAYDFINFNIPLVLGFDYRPMIFIGNGGRLFGGDLAVHLRYIFNTQAK